MANKKTSHKVLHKRTIDKSFKTTWNSMFKKKKHNVLINLSIKEDEWTLKDVPASQEFLTEKNQTIQKKIDYSKYLLQSDMLLENPKLYECFHGILFYIYYYSENKFNIKELEYHFSGGQLHKEYPTPTNSDQTNILNLFNYENINKQFTIKEQKNAFFGVTFKRIKVNPIAYSIRSGPKNNRFTRLVSFTFKGFDEKNNIWDILDERVNINDLIINGGFAIYSVQSTKKFYSSFKIEQTETGSNGSWGFSISAFDIHGIISYPTKSSVSSNNCILNDNISSVYNDQYFNLKYDPLIDMTDYL